MQGTSTTLVKRSAAPPAAVVARVPAGKRHSAAWAPVSRDAIGCSLRSRGAPEHPQIRGKKGVFPHLSRNLAPDGRLLTVQSSSRDPGLEVVQRIWPGKDPFEGGLASADRGFEAVFGRETRDFTFPAPPDEKAIFGFRMHTLPSVIGDRIGTSTLCAAWNAAIRRSDRG